MTSYARKKFVDLFSGKEKARDDESDKPKSKTSDASRITNGMISTAVTIDPRILNSIDPRLAWIIDPKGNDTARSHSLMSYEDNFSKSIEIIDYNLTFDSNVMSIYVLHQDKSMYTNAVMENAELSHGLINNPVGINIVIMESGHNGSLFASSTNLNNFTEKLFDPNCMKIVTLYGGTVYAIHVSSVGFHPGDSAYRGISSLTVDGTIVQDISRIVEESHQRRVLRK